MCYVTIMSPDFAHIWFIEFSYLVLKLIIGSAQSQPQGLKNVFNRVESYSAGLFTYESTYDNRIFRQIYSQNFYGSGSEIRIRDPDPGSGIRIRFFKKRGSGSGSGSGLKLTGSETLFKTEAFVYSYSYYISSLQIFRFSQVRYQ